MQKKNNALTIILVIAVIILIGLLLNKNSTTNTTGQAQQAGAVNYTTAVAITQPQGGVLSGVVTVAASVSVPNVARVDFYRCTSGGTCATLIGSATSFPYAVSWDTTKNADDGWLLSATAYDTMGTGWQTKYPLQVSTNNGGVVTNAPFSISIISPANNATLPKTGTAQFSATSSELSHIILSIDGKAVKICGSGDLNSVTSCAYAWDLSAVKGGKHTLAANGFSVATGQFSTSSIGVKK